MGHPGGIEAIRQEEAKRQDEKTRKLSEYYRTAESQRLGSQPLPNISVDYYQWNCRPHFGMTDGMTTFELEELGKSGKISYRERTREEVLEELGMEEVAPWGKHAGRIRARRKPEEKRDYNRRPDNRPVQPAFFRQSGFRSVPAPNVYRLGQDLSTFREADLEVADKLPVRNSDQFDKVEKAREELRKNLSSDYGLRMKRRHPTEPGKRGERVHKEYVRQNIPVINSIEPSASPQSRPAPPQKWKAYKDDDGDTYYLNLKTGKTQWELPDILKN